MADGFTEVEITGNFTGLETISTSEFPAAYESVPERCGRLAASGRLLNLLSYSGTCVRQGPAGRLLKAIHSFVSRLVPSGCFCLFQA